MANERLFTVKLPNINGVPRDGVANSFVCFGSLPWTTPLYAAAATAIEDFYNENSLTHPIAYYLSQVLSRASLACTLNAYDISGHLDGSPHGSPVYTSVFTLGNSDNAAAVPNEVALACSFHADYTGALETGASAAIPTPEAAQDMGAPATHTGRTRPKSRFRGRVYLGPLNSTSNPGVMNPAGGFSIPAAGFVADVRASALDLIDDLTTNNTFLGVWSRRDALVRLVTGGWVDNDYDTQRRRGNRAPTKTAF